MAPGGAGFSKSVPRGTNRVAHDGEDRAARGAITECSEES